MRCVRRSKEVKSIFKKILSDLKLSISFSAIQEICVNTLGRPLTTAENHYLSDKRGKIFKDLGIGIGVGVGALLGVEAYKNVTSLVPSKHH